MIHNPSQFLSRPVELHWAGWRTDTLHLQQQGWSISADQNVMRNTMQLALRNERAGMVGLTAEVPWEYMRLADQGYGARLPTLPVQMMSRNIELMHWGAMQLTEFQPIDAQPQMVHQQRTKLEDFVHFAPAHTRTEQLIVPEETVDDLMARIMDLQHGPRIERIRAEVAEGQRVDFTGRQKFHAQIISLAA